MSHFRKSILEMKNFSEMDGLENLKLFPIEQRRMQADLREIFKTMNVEGVNERNGFNCQNNQEPESIK